jgi:hypothetical protein
MLEQLLKDHPEDAGGVFTSIQGVLAASAGQPQIAEKKIKLAIEKEKGLVTFITRPITSRVLMRC